LTLTGDHVRAWGTTKRVITKRFLAIWRPSRQQILFFM